MSYDQYSLAEKPAKPALPAKTKRIKTVFGPHDTGVEHVWAHPRGKGPNPNGQGFEQTFATNPQRNFYFKTHEDNTRVLYSYRDSYPIGARFQVGKRIVFLVRSGKPYSNTTAGHMSACANAARNNGEVFHVPYVIRQSNFGYRDSKPDKATHAENLKDFASRIQESIDEYLKARSLWRIENSHLEARELTADAKKYAKVFGLKLPKLPAVPKLDADRLAKAKQREAIQDARNAERRALQAIEDEKQAAQKRIENAETIAKWKNGEDVSLPYGLGQYALLRVIRQYETGPHSPQSRYVVETSQRVTVPVSGPTGAARLLRFLEACKASGRTYQSNGHSEHIGSFTVQSFKPEETTWMGTSPEPQWILTAGCHRILWSEVQSIADAVRDASVETPETQAQ
jgi:hypothetical protein